MRVAILSFLSLLVVAGQTRAQQNDQLRRPALGTFDVIALRVEFQPDTTRFTTGDGTFSGPLFADLSPSIDPLPHDSAYFADHLDFLSHYVRHVSDGAATVRTHVLPGVVRVSQTMGAYAPTGADANGPEQVTRLARLVEEAWSLADEQVDFSVAGLDLDRTVFLIFHAGVGRDIELTGTILDRTPEDLPSLFFGEDRLAELLPDARISFKGMPVQHSLIVPRTESRRGVDFVTDEPFLVEISINGMLAASFFNFLGVPDLFDTESGQSAIGPFGLMDPLGIFAYNGLFPPEPSAWTKYFLGWANPVEIRGADSVGVALETTSRPGVADMARVWISESEYFLVENRQRDPEGDGVRLRVRVNGEVQEFIFDNHTEGFNAQDVSALPGGVVVGVDDYDWALPGGLDEDGNELNGGILIWHVNEGIIRSRLGDNAVNANPSRRGVDLEEADAAQDLGFPSENPFAPQADLGSPFDFWYEGNPVRVVNQVGQEIALYRNRFGPDTFPSSDATDGGDSYVLLEGFTARGNEMSFVYRRTAGATAVPATPAFAPELDDVLAQLGVRPGVASVWRMGERTIADVQGEDGNWTIFIVDPARDSAVHRAATPSAPLNDRLVWADSLTGTLRFTMFDPATGVLATATAPEMEAARLAAPIVVSGGRAHLLASAGSETRLFSFDGGQIEFTDLPEIGYPIGLTAMGEEGVVAFGYAGARVIDGASAWSYELAPGGSIGHPVFGRDAAGDLGVIPLPDRNGFLVLGPDGGSAEVSGAVGGSLVALADVTGDAHLEILTASDSLLFAYARSGALAAGFPIRLSASAAGAPVVAADDAGSPHVLVPLTSGVVDGFETTDRGLERIDGFPLPVGAVPAALSLVEDDAGLALYALSETGMLHGWTLPHLTSASWAGPFGDPKRAAYAEREDAGEPQDGSERLLVTGETYNWPNPIREGRTYLRCLTSEDSEIRITIINGAGMLVDELTIGSTRAGVPTEVMWETNAASGLYFARVTATSVTGREESTLVRMAVIR